MKRNTVATVYWVIFFTSFAISAFCVLLLILFGTSSELGNWVTNTLFAAGSLSIGEGIAIWEQKSRKTNKNDCTYENYLSNLGIIKIYKNREDPNHIADLLHELKNLPSTSETTVKMIGVALIFYFRDLDTSKTYELAMEIKQQSKKHKFNALISCASNPELKRRNDFTKLMDYTVEMVSGNTEIDILQDILATKDVVMKWKKSELSKLKKSTQNKKRKYRKNLNNQVTDKETVNEEQLLENQLHITIQEYSGAPYATIIFINDRIYYTPNMPYEKKRGTNEYDENPNPTLCILRKSALGEKLEKSFDIIWEKRDKT